MVVIFFDMVIVFLGGILDLMVSVIGIGFFFYLWNIGVMDFVIIVV